MEAPTKIRPPRTCEALPLSKPTLSNLTPTFTCFLDVKGGVERTPSAPADHAPQTDASKMHYSQGFRMPRGAQSTAFLTSLSDTGECVHWKVNCDPLLETARDFSVHLWSSPHLSPARTIPHVPQQSAHTSHLPPTAGFATHSLGFIQVTRHIISLFQNTIY